MALDPSSGYYDQGGIEVFKIIKAKLTVEQWKGFLLGNAMKYSLRANWKDSFERDMEKCRNYSQLLVDLGEETDGVSR